MAKMRLCSKCGISLDEIRPGVFSCPRGHGEWTSGMVSQPLSRDKRDGAAYQGGAIVYTGNKSGKKRKQPRREDITNIYDRP